MRANVGSRLSARVVLILNDHDTASNWSCGGYPLAFRAAWVDIGAVSAFAKFSEPLFFADTVEYIIFVLFPAP